MLGCMNRAFNLLDEAKGVRVGMADLQDDDPDVYAMIQKADTLGTFQIESRAQMSMLPRMKPQRFYDLVIEVAIVRPGPIQGDMVHPYLRRREGHGEAGIPPARAARGAGKDARRAAVPGAGDEGRDRRRRVHAGRGRPAAPRHGDVQVTGGVSHFCDKLVGGMVERGYPRDFAERTFKQLEGFGSYGFPESHAASFAKIAYASLLDEASSSGRLLRGAAQRAADGLLCAGPGRPRRREHGVEVRPGLHQCQPLGLHARSRLAAAISPCGSGFGRCAASPMSHGAAIVAARGDAPFESVEEVWRRAGVPRAAIERLAEADAFQAFGQDRRQGLWKVRGLGEAPLPLFAAADERETAFSPEGLEPSC